jgi:hypothetical protein
MVLANEHCINGVEPGRYTAFQGDVAAVDSEQRVNRGRHHTRMTKSSRSTTSRIVLFTPLQAQYLAFIHTCEGSHGCAPAEADLQRHLA